MNNIYQTLSKSIFAITLSLGMGYSAQATICTSTGTGNWSNASIWSCGHVPAAGDSIIIASNVTEDVQSNAIAYLKINSGGSLVFSGGSKIYMLNTNSAIIVVSGGTISGGNAGSRIDYPDPSTDVSGPFSVSGPAYSTGSGFSSGSVPLPVNISSFTGEKEGAKTILKWVAENELNNDHYTIQRSNDGSKFVDIMTITAQNRSVKESYQYVDYQAEGLAYYRLEMVATNGTKATSNTLRINGVQSTDIKLNVYPNPTNGTLHYTAATTLGEVALTITDVTGRVLWTAKQAVSAGQQYNVNLDNLATGMYHFTVRMADGSSKTTLVNKN